MSRKKENQPDKPTSEENNVQLELEKKENSVINISSLYKEDWANEYEEDEYGEDEYDEDEYDDEVMDTVYHYLDMAESEPDDKAALRYVRKALALDPKNVDAGIMEAELSAKSYDNMLDKLKKLIDKEEENLRNEGLFDEDCIGQFWLIYETRPYMRLLDRYASTLVESGKMRLAAAMYEKMLELCEGDNFGARYRLMNIYAHFEEDKPALALLKKYKDDDSVQLLLPLSILYYKQNNLREAAKYLKKLYSTNKDTKKFFDGIRKGSLKKYTANFNKGYYRPYTIDEFLVEMEQNGYLIANSISYFIWGIDKIEKMK